jgi:hypothetical protein
MAGKDRRAPDLSSSLKKRGDPTSESKNSCFRTMSSAAEGSTEIQSSKTPERKTTA